MDKHKTVRNHIAAAKGWLNQAEDSLEQANDIRGDLNLMLAQAELQRAQEKKSRKGWLRWAIRLLPLAAALCVAVGYVLYLRPEPQSSVQPVKIYHVGDDSVEDRPEEMPENFHDRQSRQAEQDGGREMAVDDVPAASFSQEGAAPEYGGGQAAQDSQAARRQEHAGAAMPDAEMQKLMQDAGSALRE